MATLEERKEELRLADVAAAEALARYHDAIVAERRGGVKQVDVIRRTGYSREQVRRIERAGGIESDR